MENINSNTSEGVVPFFTQVPDCEFYFPNYQKSEGIASEDYDPTKLGIKLKLNRSALACVSPGFNTFFYGEAEVGLENDENPIYIIEDFDLKTFKKLLNFIRTGNITFESFEGTEKLIIAAMKFQMDELVDFCVRWLQSHIDTKIAPEVIKMGLPLIDRINL